MSQSTITPETSANLNGGKLELSRHFSMFLNKNKCAIILTSYKRNVVLSISSSRDERVSIYTSKYSRPMGLCYNDKTKTIHMGTCAHIVKFEKVDYDYDDGNYDTFLPTEMKLISDLDTHDMTVISNTDNMNEKVLVASSLQNAVITPIATYGKLYNIVYSPDFMLSAEDGKKPRKTPPCGDCCHLNSLTLNREKTQIEYVTCISSGSTISSWRECRDDGGVIIRCGGKKEKENEHEHEETGKVKNKDKDKEKEGKETEDKIISTGLSMPHSVRVCSANGKLYVLDSGRGRFCEVDTETGERTTIAFLPGYLRGLSFIDDKYAIIGSSMDRHEQCFRGLPLENILKEKRVEAKCGIYIVSLKTGEVLHNAMFPNLIEVYDVCVIPNTQMTRLCDFEDTNLLTTHAVMT